VFDGAEGWLSQPRSLADELFSRPDTLKIFISSKMRGEVLAVERVAAAEAVERIPDFASAWYWERDADAGPYCAEGICLGQAATADGLVLILAEELTPITRKEYELAYERGVPTYLLIDQRVMQDDAAQLFVEDRQRNADTTTKGFANVSELQTHILEALMRYAVGAVRRANFVSAQQRAAARRGERYV